MVNMATKSVAAQCVTRTKTDIWLIGQAHQEVPNNVLPTIGDVLRTFFYYHHVCKRTISESAKSTSDEVLRIWNKARIPTTYHPHIVAKLKGLVEEYSLIKKNKSRESDAQIARQKDFTERLDKILTPC